MICEGTCRKCLTLTNDLDLFWDNPIVPYKIVPPRVHLPLFDNQTLNYPRRFKSRKEVKDKGGIS